MAMRVPVVLSLGCTLLILVIAVEALSAKDDQSRRSTRQSGATCGARHGTGFCHAEQHALLQSASTLQTGRHADTELNAAKGPRSNKFEDGSEAPLTPSEPPLILGIFRPWGLAVMICVAGSFSTVTGSVIQKFALKEQEKTGQWKQVGELVLSPLWLLGFFLGALMPVPVDAAAYYLTSMSFVAPLSGVTVVLSMIMAPWLLGECLSPWPDLPASVIIVIGVTLTTSTGNRSDDPVTPARLYELALSPAFMFGAAVLITLLVACTLLQIIHRNEIQAMAKLRPSNPPIRNVLLPAISAAASAVFTNLALKAAMGVIKSGVPFYAGVLCVLQLAPMAFLQLQFISLGLRLYDQTIFFPMYNALMVVGNTVYGLLFYQDYVGLLKDTPSFVFFCVGVTAVSVGIALFELRVPRSPPPPEKDNILATATEVKRPGSKCEPLAKPKA